jgi:hypothetical protein
MQQLAFSLRDYRNVHDLKVGQVADRSSSFEEVYMQVKRCGTARASPEVISGILNCVCPDCSGSMGGAGRAFECQGECQRDGVRSGNSILPVFYVDGRGLSLVHGGG